MPRDSELVRAQLGDVVEWTPTEHLLAGIFDVLRAANWQRAGRRNAPKPKPIPRPGVDGGTERKRIGGGHQYTRAELEDVLAHFGQVETSGVADGG